jgi:hypothetical protein
MSSNCVLLGVVHRDRDLHQLGLSKPPVEPRSFALLVVLQDHTAAAVAVLFARDRRTGRRRALERPGAIFGLNRPTALAALRFCANQVYKLPKLCLSRPDTTVDQFWVA